MADGERAPSVVRVVGVGAGGHARVVIETLRRYDHVEVVGLLDRAETLWDTSVLGVPVLGDDDRLPSLLEDGIRHAFIGVGTTADTRPRERLYRMLLDLGFELVDAVHPSAVIADSAVIGRGATIMAGAVVNACARLGDNVIVNTGAIVEHDCVVDDHAHVATGARLASTVHVGAGAHVGLGASIRQCVRIGRQAVVGAGAVVVRDVPDGVVVVGVPARVLKR